MNFRDTGTYGRVGRSEHFQQCHTWSPYSILYNRSEASRIPRWSWFRCFTSFCFSYFTQWIQQNKKYFDIEKFRRYQVYQYHWLIITMLLHSVAKTTNWNNYFESGFPRASFRVSLNLLAVFCNYFLACKSLPKATISFLRERLRTEGDSNTSLFFK